MHKYINKQPRLIDADGEPVKLPEHSEKSRPLFGKMIRVYVDDLASVGENHESAHEWARQDSNLRPNGYEPSALPLSYGPPVKPSWTASESGAPVSVMERATGFEPANLSLEG